jgi:hypothetical protein
MQGQVDHSVSLKQWFFIGLWNVLMIISIIVDPLVTYPLQWLSAALFALAFAQILSVVIQFIPSTSNIDLGPLLISWITTQFTMAYILTFLDFFDFEVLPMRLIIIASIAGFVLGLVLIVVQARPSRKHDHHLHSTSKKWYCASCGYGSVRKFKRCPQCRVKAYF